MFTVQRFCYYYYKVKYTLHGRHDYDTTRVCSSYEIVPQHFLHINVQINKI